MPISVAEDLVKGVLGMAFEGSMAGVEGVGVGTAVGFDGDVGRLRE